MNRQTMHGIGGLAIMVLMLTCAAVAAQVDQAFAMAQKKNAEMLRQYTWKSRTEIQKGGETKSVQLMLMRFDAKGMLQSTMLSGTQQDLPERGLRGKIARKKKEDLKRDLENLKALAGSYGELPPADMQRVMSNSAPVPDTSGQPKLIRASGINLLQRGDAMTIWLDAATGRFRKIEIISKFDENTFRVVSEYQDLPNGPTHIARTVMHYPSDELTVIIENFEYVKVVQ